MQALLPITEFEILSVYMAIGMYGNFHTHQSLSQRLLVSIAAYPGDGEYHSPAQAKERRRRDNIIRHNRRA